MRYRTSPSLGYVPVLGTSPFLLFFAQRVYSPHPVRSFRVLASQSKMVLLVHRAIAMVREPHMSGCSKLVYQGAFPDKCTLHCHKARSGLYRCLAWTGGKAGDDMPKLYSNHTTNFARRHGLVTSRT